jgi:Zn finger protein HypA/HybF involved in hydrogenase expression
MSKPTYELATIVKDYRAAFEKKHPVLTHHQRVLSAIEHCRTIYLGGHIDKCDTCNHLRISYNSCRNRHCPKCQSINRERWIEDRQKDLLPATYFHVVFTLPQEINTYCLNYPKEVYDILFSASKETIETFSNDHKHLGAKTGMISILHTWGQNLSLHPHVHLIVPGGGITEDCPDSHQGWKHSKSNGSFLFPVKAMSIVYKNKFMEKLKLFLETKNKPMEVSLRRNLYTKNWVVYAKQPFMGPKQVIEYLGRYTHKIAISNHRIKNVSDGKVSFTYKDYADKSKQKLMTLEAEEFLRRFCLHILPPGFRKIRHYGILSSRSKPKLRMQQMKMGIVSANTQRQEKISWQEIAKTKLGFDVEKCPKCGSPSLGGKTGKMIRISCFDAHAPPLYYIELIKKQESKKQESKK